MDLAGAHVLVTGGAGFLGRRVCALLHERGAGELTVHRRAEHDLTEQAAVRDLFAATHPDVVVHLAAEVGGIGANRANPGRYFYANAAMGLHLLEEARRVGVAKFVQVGTVCAYPKHTPVPFCEDDLWAGYPEETNARRPRHARRHAHRLRRADPLGHLQARRTAPAHARPTRARERFGFTAEVGLDDGLQRTIAWWEQQAP